MPANTIRLYQWARTLSAQSAITLLSVARVVFVRNLWITALHNYYAGAYFSYNQLTKGRTHV